MNIQLIETSKVINFTQSINWINIQTTDRLWFDAEWWSLCRTEGVYVKNPTSLYSIYDIDTHEDWLYEYPTS